jgi:citronellol/citronellal dehydrogenase
MTPVPPTELLRAGLLEGVSVLVAGTLQNGAGLHEAAIAETCEQLGGQAFRCATQADDEAALDGAVEDAMASMGAVDLLAVDGGALFARGARASGAEGPSGGGSHEGGPGGGDSGGSHEALRDCLDSAWNATRGVVNEAFGLEGRGGRVVYVAPAVGVGAGVAARAEAARAGLENLGRTLSVEWARYGVTLVTITPGAQTAVSDVAALIAYLASPAGAYFSGCLLDLRGVDEKR